jgi:hypothetical protein
MLFTWGHVGIFWCDGEPQSCEKNSINWKISNNYQLFTLSERIVTCQPFVGLRNRALIGSRRLNASRRSTRYAVGEAVFAPCRAEQNRTERCYTAGCDDRTRQHARFQGNAGKQWPDAPQLSPGSYDWGFIRGTEMSKQSVCKEQSYESVFRKQLYERVLRSSPTSEVSIGDRHGNYEDAKCVIIWNSNR